MIASDLTLGGFAGSWGETTSPVKRKRALLSNEGVKFDANGRVAKTSVYDWDAAGAEVAERSKRKDKKKKTRVTATRARSEASQRSAPRARPAVSPARRKNSRGAAET